MMKQPLALRLYGHVFEALTPLWRWWLQRRLQRGKETKSSLDQRWMRLPPPRPQGVLVWGHAVGVGEALALAGVLKRLQELRPDLHFLITTTARTSGQALSQQKLGPQFTHWFAPVDTPSNVARFLQHWQPNLALWCEMDLWPALIDATAQRGIPRVLLNARLSAPSKNKRRWGRWLYAPLLAGFDAIWAQNQETAMHLADLGAQKDRVQVTGSIKAMVPPLSADTESLASWQTALGNRRVWVLASSHPSEEQLALEAHVLLRQTHPNALLIMVPRDVQRGAEIAALCGANTPLRSQGLMPPSNHQPCYVADTIGELGLWYRLTRVAMIGGSWAPIGGHNPFEATMLGNVVIHGPQVDNFSESYLDFDQQGRSVLAHTAQEIAVVVMGVWSTADWPDHAHQNVNTHIAPQIQELLRFLPSPAHSVR
jgi:3-deoxy-D-manno-octulosonic-acid transferase